MGNPSGYYTEHPLMRVLPAFAAAAVCGLALYFTEGVLDVLVAGGRAIRVALLPGWQPLVAFVATGALAIACVGRRARARERSAEANRSRAAVVMLPLFALALLILPYVPVLPDWVPSLQLAAGPIKWVIWLVVGALWLWTLWQSRLVRSDWFGQLTLVQASVLVGALTAAASAVAAARLAGTVVFPAGDEPHYLIIAQSIWRDGDLKIENNHARGDYREYYEHDLKPDFLTRGADGEIYSIHPVGMPVLMAPVYGFAGYGGVIVVLILCASVAAAVMWRNVAESTNGPAAATVAWAAVTLTAPFLFNTFTVYPEIVAALAVALAFTGSVGGGNLSRSLLRWTVVGLACAALPWLSTKYAPMSAALVIIAILRARELRAGVAISLPYLASVAGWFYFFYAIWGTPMPSAPYGDLVQTSVANLVFGAPGLLFDQEYGVLAYAPVYILAVTGLFAMYRRGGEVRRRAGEIALVFGVLLATVGAFRIWWGGTASPGRPVASGLLLLMTPMAIAAEAAPSGSARRAGHQLLLWISIGVAATLLIAQQGLLINNGRDGTSTLLQYWSPTWAAWSMAPTFIFHEAPIAWLHALAWLAVAAGASLLLARWKVETPGGATLAAITTLVASLLLLTIVMPRLPHNPPLPAANLMARSGLPLLDGFDTTLRPVAIRYDPFRFESAESLVSLAQLSVAPRERPDPQPIRVLHNGRFSLPAGRYHADVAWAAALARAVPIALQVGRIEPVWQTWTVQPERGAHWAVDFDLPVDANFVAFRGGGEVEHAMSRLTITPLAVVDESLRPHVPTVLAVWQYGPVTAMFHDEHASPERAGFWVLGGETARVTMVRDSETGPLTLRVHSGSEPNRVTLRMRGWDATLNLQATLPQDIRLPDSTRRLITIAVHSDKGFSPRQYDPKSDDPRNLGAWVEVVQ